MIHKVVSDIEVTVKRADLGKLSKSPRITPVDQFASKEFNLNQFGHLRSAVSALAHCQSMAEYEMIARNLSQRPAQFGCTEGMKFSDAIRVLKPRWCQMPSELNMFADALASDDYTRLQAEYDKNLEASLKRSEKSSAPASETPETPNF